jgi:UDP-N-acetylmuramoyl-tripeptide--D-alanyl-D-alanine ligase
MAQKETLNLRQPRGNMKIFLKNLFYRTMRTLARFSLRNKNPYIIGITGSVGKTSCRMIIAEILQQQLPQLKIYTSPSNYNSELGLALSVLAIENFSHSPVWWIKTIGTWILRTLQGCPYDVLVLEYGIDYPGEMEIELSIVKPDTAIFTSVDSVHAHQLGSKEWILREKTKLLNAAKDIIAYPIQSNYIASYISSAKADTLIYTLEDWVAEATHISRHHHACIQTQENLPQATFLSTFWKDAVKVSSNLLGSEHASYLTLWLQLTQIIAQRKNIAYHFPNILNFQGQLQPGRYSVFAGVGESILIDSSYNGAPQSIRLMIRNTLSLRAQCYPEHPVWLVLGEMRELGDFEQSEHEALAQELLALDIGKFFLVGNAMKTYVLPILEWAGKEVVWNKSSREMGKYIRDELWETRDDMQLHSQSVRNPLILFKWSQNTIFLEEAVKILLKNPLQASNLCRQSKEWMGKKEKWFGSL